MNAAAAHLQAAATGLGAGGPVIPILPGAVHSAGGVVAVAVLRHGEEAAEAAGLPQVEDGAQPALDAVPTARGAVAPVEPPGDLAVLDVAVGQTAGLHLRQVAGAQLAPVLREGHHLALAPRLPGPAAAVALVPLRPVGHHAVHGRAVAGLHLVHGPHARETPQQGRLLEDPLPLPLHGEATGCPLRPHIEDTVLAVAQPTVLPEPSVAVPHLLQHAAALHATGLRLLDAPAPTLEAFAAGGAADGPALPGAELAGVREAAFARLGLLQVPVAGQASVHGRLGDVPAPVPLAPQVARGVGAGTPVRPVGQLAVHRLVASGRANPGLQQSAGAGRAALAVHLGHHPLSLAQAHAGGLVPITPVPKLAVHPHALPGTVLLGARAHVQLGPEAGGVLAADEEGVSVGLHQIQRPAPHRGAPAGGTAGARPLRPHAEAPTAAVARAVGDLLGILLLAQLASRGGQLLDDTVPSALSAAVSAVAPI